MSDFWKSFLPLAMIAVMAFGLGIVIDRGCTSTTRDTTYVPVVLAFPPVVVTPNPVQTTPVFLNTKNEQKWKMRVDSLQQAVGDKDKVIARLSRPRESQQAFSAISPDGLTVGGTLFTVYDPITSQLSTNIVLDSVRITTTTITVTQTVTEFRVEYLISACAIGVLAGALLVR